MGLQLLPWECNSKKNQSVNLFWIPAMYPVQPHSENVQKSITCNIPCQNTASSFYVQIPKCVYTVICKSSTIDLVSAGKCKLLPASVPNFHQEPGLCLC